MPEGDALHLTAERLSAALATGPLLRAELRWPTVGGVNLVGTTAVETVSYGKHLFTRLDDGHTLHTHLRMEGFWRVARTGTREAGAGNPNIRAVLATKHWTCTGWHLGMLDLVRTRDEPRLLEGLGPDVLGPDFVEAGTDVADGTPDPAETPRPGIDGAVERLGAAAGRPLCDALLDQRTVAGLGTIWMAESLFARRLWPWTPAGELTDEERRALLLTARRLMERSVAIGRSRGLSAVEVSVHGRAGKPCRRCRTPIAVGTANEKPFERPVFWCPTCQAAEPR